MSTCPKCNYDPDRESCPECGYPTRQAHVVDGVAVYVCCGKPTVPKPRAGVKK